jgi:EamA domain-containing membrane protein RarD
MFLFMGAPSMSSVGLAAAVFHRFRDVNRAAIVLAGVSVAIDAWLLGRLVWGTIIDPANPHGPGYWL